MRDTATEHVRHAPWSWPFSNPDSYLRFNEAYARLCAAHQRKKEMLIHTCWVCRRLLVAGVELCVIVVYSIR